MASDLLLRAPGRDLRRVSAQGQLDLCRGRLQTRKWTDKEGVERYTTEIKGDRMQMLGGRGGATGFDNTAREPEPATAPAASGKPAQKKSGGFDDLDDDIPF